MRVHSSTQTESLRYKTGNTIVQNACTNDRDYPFGISYCETNDKRQFIVEMKMYWSTNFMQRVLFNSSKVYVSQLKKGEPFSSLQPVYSLNLIDDIFEPAMEEYYHYYHLVHDKNTQKVIDGYHLVFVEFCKKDVKCVSKLHFPIKTFGSLK